MGRKKIIFFMFLVVMLILGKTGHLSAQSLLDTGIKEYKAENYEEALEILTKGKSQQPDSSLIAFSLGLTYKQMGHYREATTQFEETKRLFELGSSLPVMSHLLVSQTEGESNQRGV